MSHRTRVTRVRNGPFTDPHPRSLISLSIICRFSSPSRALALEDHHHPAASHTRFYAQAPLCLPASFDHSTQRTGSLERNGGASRGVPSLIRARIDAPQPSMIYRDLPSVETRANSWLSATSFGRESFALVFPRPARARSPTLIPQQLSGDASGVTHISDDERQPTKGALLYSSTAHLLLLPLHPRPSRNRPEYRADVRFRNNESAVVRAARVVPQRRAQLVL